MDNLKNLWAEMSSSFDGPEITPNQLTLKSRVETPLAKMRSNFRMNLVLAGICGFIFVALFILVEGFWFRLLTGIILAGYAAITWQTTYLYNRYLKNLYPDEDIKNYLQGLHNSIKKGLKYQELIAIFFYPVSLAAGYFLSLYERGEAEAFFTEPFYWVLLLAVIIVMTPLLFLLSRWMYNISFRSYLNQIEEVLNELETEKQNDY